MCYVLFLISEKEEYFCGNYSYHVIVTLDRNLSVGVAGMRPVLEGGKGLVT